MDKLIEVVFLGYQERIERESIMLVNEVEGHSTVKYDSKKHKMINEEKKGGEKRMKHDDDQCVQCGGIRVAGSPLCASCLIATVNSFAPAHDIAEAKIKELKRKLTDCRELRDLALRYGFKRNQENTRLLKHIKGLELKIREVMEDGKNRVHSDK